MTHNRLPIERSELDNLAEVFESLAVLRGKGKERRSSYLETVQAMGEECLKLRGVELEISGRLHGRGGTTVYGNESISRVEGMHVRVGSAQVETYEGIIGLAKEHLPVISIAAYTLDGSESVSAWLGTEEYGVTAKLLETRPVQT